MMAFSLWTSEREKIHKSSNNKKDKKEKESKKESENPDVEIDTNYVNEMIDFSQYITCGICMEDFSPRNHKPIILDCGHTLCFSCLNQISRNIDNNQRRCPFDKKRVKATNSYPVNYLCLNLSNEYNEKKKVLKEAKIKAENEKLKKQIKMNLENGIYNGEFVNKKGFPIREGYGVMEYSKGNTYEGQWKNNQRNGKGKFTDLENGCYEGEWLNDLPHGKGKQTFFKGEILSYEGGWRNGRFFGLGKIVYRDNIEIEKIFLDEEENDIDIKERNEIIKLKKADGSLFIGRLEKDKLNDKEKFYEISGNGDIYYGNFIQESSNKFLKHGSDSVIYCENGNRIKGNYFYDSLVGESEMTFPNGDVYIGSIVNGKREGIGTTKHSDGSIYIGSYKNDLRDGEGKITKGKYSFSGTFKNGLKEGQGIENLESGESYAGNYSKGLRNGNGVAIFTNGDTYKGEWKDDKMNGAGYLVFSDGKEIHANFANGVIIDNMNGNKKNCLIF